MNNNRNRSLNYTLVIHMKQAELTELCRRHHFDEAQVYRMASSRVREEDLFGQQPYPLDRKTPSRATIVVAKNILRLQYKHLAATEPDLARACPGWWEVTSERGRIDEIREKRNRERSVFV
jgi:hypothetical protein